MAQESGPHPESKHRHLSPFSILILTGLSGSGKSTVLRALEDIGYFCVDNLPLGLLMPFLDMQSAAVASGRRIALVMDVRTEGFLKNFSQAFRHLEEMGHHLHIIFLEADDATLIRRFSQTRRQHPLADHDTIVQALHQERNSLAGLRQLAHRIIDSSHYNPHQLRELIKDEYSELAPRQRMWLHLISFAYKKGIPPEADMVLDVRFLPNPYFVEGLQPLTGRRPRGPEIRSGAVLKPRLFSTTCCRLWTFCCPATRKRARRTSPWPSVAPAGSTVRWSSPTSWGNI